MSESLDLIKKYKIYMKTKSILIYPAIAVVVAGISVTGTWAYANLPSTTITACVSKVGIVRILGDGVVPSKCLKNEKLLSWNIKGERGDKGTAGLQGPQGVQGPVGEQGPKGEQGSDGAAGSIVGVYQVVRGPFTVNRNEVSSFGIGCNMQNHIAIAAGPDTLNGTGGGIYWKTTQSRPDMVAADSWLTTVIYDGPDQTASFSIVLKCMAIQ